MDAATLIYIHQFLTAFFADKEDPIAPPGVKDMATLESAVARPYATVNGQDAYKTVFDKSAALFHSVVCNHSFHNGNKRAALLSTMYFMSEYGYLMDRSTDDDMYEFTRGVSAHEITEERRDEVPAIATWLEKISRKQRKDEKPLKLSELREALGRFGYHMQEEGMVVNITKDGEVVEIVRKKGKQGLEDYDPGYISKLRKRLRLVPEEGIDSMRFYGQKGLSDELNQFMQLRIEVMKRLAKI